MRYLLCRNGPYYLFCNPGKGIYDISIDKTIVNELLTKTRIY